MGMMVGADLTSVRTLPLSIVCSVRVGIRLNIRTFPISIGPVAVLVVLDERILEEICESKKIEMITCMDIA